MTNNRSIPTFFNRGTLFHTAVLLSAVFVSFVCVEAQEQNKTRVVLSVSKNIDMPTHWFKADPPQIVIEFDSQIVRSDVNSEMPVPAGIVSAFESEYVAPNILKRFIVHLKSKAAYSLETEYNKILIDIADPKESLHSDIGVDFSDRSLAMRHAMDAVSPSDVVASNGIQPVIMAQPAWVPETMLRARSASRSEPEPSGGLMWAGMILFSIISISLLMWRRSRIEQSKLRSAINYGRLELVEVKSELNQSKAWVERLEQLLSFRSEKGSSMDDREEWSQFSEPKDDPHS